MPDVAAEGPGALPELDCVKPERERHRAKRTCHVEKTLRNKGRNALRCTAIHSVAPTIPNWAEADLNRRHTDFQSVKSARLVALPGLDPSC